MRFIETKKLNDYIIEVGSFFEDGIVQNFSERLDSIKDVSIQNFSIEHDRAFLREVSSVLNVIVSIIYHPHISNKREEVIIRIEQAQQVGQEAFLATIKDGRLWKKHDIRMIPEEVYYYQHEDELRIYENRFIGFLIDLIDRELARFSSFYLSRLPTLVSFNETLDSKQIGAVIVEIDRLRRKTQFIKNTHFYREVSKGKPISPKIQPTNILLKDRLYRFCFKFYKSVARYEDISSAKRDLRSYYTIMLFKALRKNRFELVETVEGIYLFKNPEFSLLLENVGDGGLSMLVECNAIHTPPAKHFLSFSVETERQSIELDSSCMNDYEGIEMLSLWDICYADLGVCSEGQIGTEAELIERWLKSKISIIATDKNIYKKYCPVCRSRGVDATDEIYTCPSCNSRYVFNEGGTDERVWFRKVRKRWFS